MSNLQNFVANNKEFKKNFKNGDKPLPPARSVAVVTCMDARIHIEPALGLKIGDSHVIRNAGNLTIPDSLDDETFVLTTTEGRILCSHHTDCGMVTFDNNHIHGVLKKDLGDAAEAEGKKFDWLTFKNLEQSVRDDIKIIADSPLIPKDIPVHGFIYSVEDGGLTPVN